MEAGARMTPGRSSLDASGASGTVGFAACQLAARLRACAVIASVRNMAEAMRIARFRPQIPLVMITRSSRVYQSLALVHGVAPLFSSDSGMVEPAVTIGQAGEWLFNCGLAQPGDKAVLLYASTADEEEPDSLRVVRL
jgi:pyruvate kinase